MHACRLSRKVLVDNIVDTSQIDCQLASDSAVNKDNLLGGQF